MHHNTVEATPGDSAVVPETPKQPRGILKQNDVHQKKRRVAFAGSDEQRTSSSEEGDQKQVLNLTKIFTFISLPLSTSFCFFHFNTDAKIRFILHRLKQ